MLNCNIHWDLLCLPEEMVMVQHPMLHVRLAVVLAMFNGVIVFF
jgi:hypothetical protein